MTRFASNHVSIELPDDWEPWNQNRWATSETLLAAKIWTGKWPNMEITDGGQDTFASVHETKVFAHRWTAREGAEFLDERVIDVDGHQAYEFCYMRKPLLRRAFYFCKVVVVVQGTEYLIQLASRDLSADKPVFDRIVQSVQFELA